MKLHYAPGTISIAVAIALEETGQTYEPVLVDFGQGAQQSGEYLAKNPKGRVPLLETERGLLTETGAILELIAPEMVPEDPWAAAAMRETMFYLAGTMHVAHAHRMRGSRWADQDSSFADMRAKVPDNMSTSCAYLEGHLPLAPFSQGEKMTLADPYLFVVLTWLEGDSVDISKFPKLDAFRQMMWGRDAVKAVAGKGML